MRHVSQTNYSGQTRQASLESPGFTLTKHWGLLVFALAASLLFSSGKGCAEYPNPAYAQGHAQTEYSGRNDSRHATTNPQNRRDSRFDRNITAAIHRSILRNRSLSPAARNISVITRNGVVTLRGQVKNQREKNKLQAIARNQQGVRQVYNQLQTNRPSWRRR